MLATNPALLRGQRLQSGKCPEHGSVLVTKGDFTERGESVGKTYGCATCSFTIEARYGTRLMKLLR